MIKGVVHLVLVAVCLGFSYAAVSSYATWQETPETPQPVNLADLASVRGFVVVQDGVLVCQAGKREGNQDWVPIVSADGVAMVVAELGKKTLCSALQLPIKALVDDEVALGAAKVEDLRGSLAAMGVEPRWVPVRVRPRLNPKDHARDEVIVFLVLAFVFGGIEALTLRQTLARRRQQQQQAGATRAPAAQGPTQALGAGVSSHGSAAAVPGAAGVLQALTQNAVASADDPVLPAGPLALTDAAWAQSRRGRIVGAPLLGGLGAVWLGGAVWAGAALAEDQWVWRHGVPVDADVKGETTRYQGVFVNTVLHIAYQLPAAHDGQAAPVLSKAQSFLTFLAGPGDTVGSVRALPDEPERVTTENAATSWPWRLPTPLLLLGLCGLCVYGAVDAWRRADRLPLIASDPREVVVKIREVTGVLTNGAFTHFKVSGVVIDTGTAIAFTLPAATPPLTSLVFADGSGDRIVGVCARSHPALGFEPLLPSLAPFQVSMDQKARAQAVLAARGSPTVLV